MKRAASALILVVAAQAALLMTPAVADDVQQAVDGDAALVRAAVETAGLTMIAQIDHARLAAAEEVVMPPSRVQIFSDPVVNTMILAENIRAGLDLPFRVLAYAEDGIPKVSYTSSDFLRQRHGLSGADGRDAFDRAITQVTSAFGARATPAPTEPLAQDYGIIELRSDLGVAEAAASLASTVKAQNDTVWFGTVDFTAEARALGADLPDAVLLLFGGPAPGGVAMADFPAIGLDAFCQKLLVYAAPDGGSIVLFNDIAALAELHHGASAPPHHALNSRLTQTFEAAL